MAGQSASPSASRKCAPIAARTTFGLYGSALPGATSTSSTPAAAAERSSVPTLPGSRTLSSTSTSERRATSICGNGTTATTPCGVTVSLIAASTLSDTVSPAHASTRRCPAVLCAKACA